MEMEKKIMAIRVVMVLMLVLTALSLDLPRVKNLLRLYFVSVLLFVAYFHFFKLNNVKAASQAFLVLSIITTLHYTREVIKPLFVAPSVQLVMLVTSDQFLDKYFFKKVGGNRVPITASDKDRNGEEYDDDEEDDDDEGEDTKDASGKQKTE